MSMRCSDVEVQEQLVKSLFVMFTRHESSPVKERMHPDEPSQLLKVQSISSRMEDVGAEETENSALPMWFLVNLPV